MPRPEIPAGEGRAPRKKTRDAMMELAEELIALHGPDDFLLQDITGPLGLTPPAF